MACEWPSSWKSHPRIEQVFYPGLESHPYHEVALRHMRGFGGLVTFLVKDADWRETAAIVDAVKIPRIAPSLGGVESLIEQPLVMSYYQMHAGRAARVRHSGQHDSDVVWHRECGRPGRRSGAGARFDGIARR